VPLAARGKGRDEAFIDRLALNEARVAAMAKGLRDIAALPDPVGEVAASWTRPNGLQISRVRVPLGVIGIIYESRPNVTADAGGLCLKSGNAVILRSGSESFLTSLVICNALTEGLAEVGLPEAAIQLVPTVDRQAVGFMLAGLGGAIDVIVPRGGKTLVARVQDEARVPVFAHLEGLCHTYIDKTADGDYNLGGYSNKQVDALIDKQKTEVDPKKRAEIAHEVSKIHMQEFGHIPLHFQVIPWAMRSNVSVVHRADNRLTVKWVKIS